MLRRCWAGSLLPLCLVLWGMSAASAQPYPSKVIRIVVGLTGGSLDLTARVIADGISASMGQPVVIDNRANVTIAGEVVAKAPPDGYTLLMTGSNLWLLPLMQSASYDPIRDFSAITLATRSPSLLVIHPALPVKSVKELIALARARPGELLYGSGAPGSASHLSAELFRAMARIRLTHVPYRSAPRGLIDLLGGHVQLMFPVAASVAPYIESGKLRALAVTSAEPSPLAPGVPTIADAGVAGYESISIAGVFAPPRLADSMTTRLNQEIARVLRRPDTREKFLRTGVEAVGSTPEEFTATIKAEMARMGKVIRDAGIRAE